MSQVLILLRKSLLNFSRARAAVILTFIVPAVLILIIGNVFGLSRGQSGAPSGIPVALVNASGDPLAQRLVDALKAEKTFRIIDQTRAPDGQPRPLTEADARTGMHDNDYHFALIIPADMVSDDQIGLHLKFLSDPRNEMESQLVNGMLQKVIFSNVPQLLGQTLQRRAQSFIGANRLSQFNATIANAVSSNFGGNAAEIQRRIEAGDYFGAGGLADNASAAAGTNKSNDIFSRIVRIDSEQVSGKEVKNPMAARTVGGYAIMFLLFAVSNSAATMFEERSSGVFQRLLSSPVSPSHILWARFLFGLILGLVQIATLFVAGRLFFGLEIFNHVVPLFAVALAAAAACSAFGMLIAAVAPSAQAASGIATLVVLSMSAVGGAWFPTSIMPEFIQKLAKLTLVYWSVEGFTDVLWAGKSLLEVMPKVGILAAIAAVVLAFSMWRFNRTQFFD